MRVHYLQHVPFEGPAWIGEWLRVEGCTVSGTRLFEEPTLPEVAAFDLLVLMGGPMSVNDEADLPWLIAEKHLVREAIVAGKAVLGICLGAQLIASALGARVYRNALPEIGWFPVEGLPVCAGSFQFPGSLDVLHWHGETFDLPAGAELLASSVACKHQAFQIGDRVIGLQFHLESTPVSVAALLEHCADELVPGPWVQSAERISSVGAAQCAAAQGVLGELLAYLQRKLDGQ